jgi:SET domain-containing protein
MQPLLSNSTVAETALVCFRPSAIHGVGGFAKADIAAGTRTIEYVGEKITKAESLRRCESNNEYIFSLDDAHDLDGNVPWNPARCLNHSCDPNCEAEPDGGRIWIVAQRDILAGEEITFNYSYDLQDYREHPCRCGAADCVGYIVATEFFEHVKWQWQSRLTPAAATFNPRI